MNDPLRDRLSELARLHRRQVRRERFVRAVTIWLAVLTIALLLDAGWSLIGAAFEDDPTVLHELSPTVRAAMGLALLIGLGIAFTALRLPSRMRRLDEHDYARWCEQRADIAGNRLVNAVQLASRDWPDALPAALSRRAVESGRDAIARIDPLTLIDPARFRRARRRLIATAASFVGLVVLSTVLLAPVAPWRAVMRLADPFGDHPPASRHHWQVRLTPEPTAIGDTLHIGVMSTHPAKQPPHVVLFDQQGQRQAEIVMAPESPSNLFSLDIPNLRQPMRGMIVGSHARSRRFIVKPVRLPRLLEMNLSMRPPDSEQWIALPAAASRKPIVGPVGATVEMRVKANRDDANIDHPAADGLRLQSKLTAGEQKITFRLASRDGLTSRQSHTLELIGLKPAELAEYIEQQNQAVQATIAADLNSGDPTEATATGGDPNESESSTTQSSGATTGFDPQATGTGGDQPAEIAPPDPLAQGNVVRSVLLDPALPVAYRALAGRAPAAYREPVAEYFLRISRDADTESSP